MIITESSVNLAARYESRQSMFESLRVQRLPAQPAGPAPTAAADARAAPAQEGRTPAPPAGNGPPAPQDRGEGRGPSVRGLDRAAEVLASLAQMQTRFPMATAAAPEGTAPAAAQAPESSELLPGASLMEQMEFSLLKALIERWSGKRISLFSLSEAARAAAATPPEAAPEPIEAAPAPEPGFRAERYTRIEATQSVSFMASASVRTADGQQIDIDLELTMRSEFYAETRSVFESGGAMQDPLVININRPAAELADTRFSFDIDADGVAEQLATLRPGSGFVALDRNGNGSIDDGTELFGAQTGDGFAELAAFDEDGNGWIDGNDSVFSKLRFWSPDGEGGSRLLALADLGVGALFLGKVATPFDLRDGTLERQGVIRDTGFYLTESGSGGILQKIDLVA
jgi:hypothetical protein